MRLRDLVHPHVLYDTIEVPLPCKPGFKFALFRDLQGKTREQTNFDTPLRLHCGEAFRLDSVVVLASYAGLLATADLTLKADDRMLVSLPLSDLVTPRLARDTFMDNTDIRGRVGIIRSVPGTGVATVRVELHGVLAKPIPKEWRPE
ncbi:MAG: hypothetical protein WC986_14805 [Elusimicrobiota bacterium]